MATTFGKTPRIRLHALIARRHALHARRALCRLICHHAHHGEITATGFAVAAAFVRILQGEWCYILILAGELIRLSITVIRRNGA